MLGHLAPETPRVGAVESSRTEVGLSGVMGPKTLFRTTTANYVRMRMLALFRHGVCTVCF
jgi:hypothetical protein